MSGYPVVAEPVSERPDEPPDQGTEPMPEPRGLYFVINERQRAWWLYGAEQPLYGAIDAEPLPTEPQHQRSSDVGRLATRLLMIVRPLQRTHGEMR
jgi:hypothetical protein